MAIKKRLIDENPFERVFKITVGKTNEDKIAFAQSLRELVKNGAETEEIIKKIESGKTKRQKNPFSEAELKLMFKEEQELNKTESSVRVIYLCDQALKAFKRQYKLTGGNKYGTVFLNQYGKPYQSI